MTKEFKEGDWVYILPHRIRIKDRTMTPFKVVRSGNSKYPLEANDISFNKQGHFYVQDTYPSVVHATEENAACLRTLYGLNVEEVCTDRDKLIAHLNKGGAPVVCKTGNTDYNLDYVSIVARYDEVSDSFILFNGQVVNYAEPLNDEIKILTRLD